MRKPFDSNLRASAPFALMILLLGLGVWNAWRSEKSITRAIAERSLEQEKILDMEALISALTDMETGQRGFIITGDEICLGPYQSGTEELAIVRLKLDPWLSTEPRFTDSWSKIQTLISEKTEELSLSIQTRRDQGFGAAQDVVTVEVEKQLLDEIRSRLGEILDQVGPHAVALDLAAKKSLKKNTLATVMLSLAAVIISLTGVFMLFKVIEARGETRDMELEKLLAERADREKSRFLANMSHEIRTPLNAILGFGELLETEVEGERGKKYLKAIRTSGGNLTNLINDILDLSKIEAGGIELDLEPIEIRKFADELQVMFAQKAVESGLDFSVNVAEDCFEALLIDSLRIRQILTNLIGNAFKFADSGSITVDLGTRSIEGTDEIVTFEARVTDTGRGIPAEKLEHIFKPFKQVELEDETIGGTGLGLTICRELAKLMNGTIEVESQWKKGSTFTLRLNQVPLAVSPGDSDTEVATTAALDAFEPSLILVVDDNAFNRELISGYFHGTGHTLVFATNGKEGVDQTLRIKPDVVLMDIRMPVMDGREAFRKIKSSKDPEIRKIPILSVTASTILEEERELRKEFDGHLRKPFSRAQLAAALCDILPGRSPDSSKGPTTHEAIAFEIKDNLTDWPEVLQILQTWSQTRLPDLKAVMALSEVAAFADDLQELGRKHNCAPLVTYGKSLKSHSKNFEMSATETALRSYDSLLANLAKTLGDEIPVMSEPSR